MRLKMTWTLLSAIIIASCATTSSLPQRVERFPPRQSGRQAADFRAVAQKGMVVAAHPWASQAGAQMLEKGGNAVDAATAASFVISVVRPHSTGLGGGGFMLYFDHGTKETSVVDFRERAPKASHKTMYLDQHGDVKQVYYDKKVVQNPSVNGHLAVAIPGLVKGLIETQAKYGKLPLATVMAPAIKAATLGFPVYPTLADALEERKEILAIYPSSVKVFFKEGRVLRLGELLVQSDLAKTLTQISEQGEKIFYQGAIGDKILAEIKRGNGIITAADLKNYSVLKRTAVKGTYRGNQVVSMPPPSSGGTHIIEMLNMLEGDDVAALGPNSLEYTHLLTEVMRRAFADRSTYMGDPEFVKIPLDMLLSKDYARDLRKSIDPIHATPSTALRNPTRTIKESPSTTHISVVDRWGNAVSTTQTINYSFGSCVVAEGTGIVLNDEMDDFSIKPGTANAFGLVQGEANAIAANKTPLSSMSPTFVFDKNGEILLVAGSPGGPKIISATLQTMINVIDFKLPLLDAVHALRIHHQWLPDQLKVEPNRLSAEDSLTLKNRGHTVTPTESIGEVQAILRTADGTWEGVSDSRAEGVPVGY